jgi:hypothetical protein
MNDPKLQKSFAEAGEEKEGTLAGEILSLLKHNKKWWLIPIIAVLVIFGVLLILGSTGAAPFIYTLF